MSSEPTRDPAAVTYGVPVVHSTVNVAAGKNQPPIQQIQDVLGGAAHLQLGLHGECPVGTPGAQLKQNPKAGWKVGRLRRAPEAP